MNADKLASFRVDSELWQQFQGYAKENNTNASALLVAYIKSVVNTGNVITSNENVNTSSEGKKFSLSIQDIDKCIDDKINQYIQNIDAINTLSIQDIDERISESISDGDIGEAIAELSQSIAKNYESMMGQFNGLLEEVQDLKSQVQELKSIPTSAPKKINRRDVKEPFRPKTPEEVITFLGIENILNGEEYWEEQPEIKDIDTKIKDNFEYFKSLGVSFKGMKDTAVSRLNLVLPWLGYKGTMQNKTIKQSNGVGVNKYIAVKVD